jgi:putative DNA primase/helicase
MTLSKKSDLFEDVEDHARSISADLLSEWLPDGVQKGREWIATNPTRADRHLGSFRINTTTYKWRDFADDASAKGGGLVSLYAYLFCGGNDHDARTKAMLELGKRFGLIDSTSSSAKIIPLRQPSKPKPKGDDWQSMVPPPDNVGRPPFWGNPIIHEYRMPGVAFPVRYVARIEKPDGKKDFCPWTYGTSEEGTKWHQKHPKVPMCLYGLDRLAATPDAPLLIQEGEQKTDDVQGVLGGDWACVAWSGGANAVPKHDWTVADRRKAYVCGDAVDGFAAMMEVAGIIHGKAVEVWTVDTSMFPKGWDLGNAATGKMVKKGELVWEDPDGPWSKAKIEDFIRDHSTRYEPDLGDADPEGDSDEDSEWKDEGDTDRAGNWWIRPLGHAHGIMYYLARRSWTVFAISHDQHTKNKLIGMAPMEYWNQTRFGANRKSIAWDEAMDWLIRQCENVGPYKIDTVRGRGAWLDNGRTVLHLGTHLLVDGVPHSLDLPNSRHVYEKREGINEQTATPLKSSEAGQLHKLIERFKWEDQGLSPRLMSGWIVCALVCGALDWRPAIWITGGSGAGKTTLLQDIIEPVLGGLVCKRSSASTEAGIRQGLDGDALAVLFDEAEAESAQDRHRMQGVFDLVRQSSKEGSAPIVKGTQSQTGAKSYTLRSSFLFSSINVSMNKLADESRITVLGLATTAKGDKVAMADYAALRRDITATLTTEFRAGLLARIVSLMPKINANARTFSRACADEMGSNRAGDQIGAMLAGYYALTSSREITVEEARDIVAGLTLDDANSADAERDEQRLVNFVFQQLLTVKVGGSPYDRTIGGLVKAATPGGDKNVDHEVAAEVLLRHGIKYDAKEGGVWIANKHAALAEFLKDTPWSVNWNRALKRLDGAIASAAPVWFGPDYPGRPPRAVFVPVNPVPPQDESPEEV